MLAANRNCLTRSGWLRRNRSNHRGRPEYLHRVAAVSMATSRKNRIRGLCAAGSVEAGGIDRSILRVPGHRGVIRADDSRSELLSTLILNLGVLRPDLNLAGDRKIRTRSNRVRVSTRFFARATCICLLYAVLQ